MLKKSLYINLLLIFFPAFSLSYPLTGIYFQSRILGFPLLVWYIFTRDRAIRKDLIIFTIPLLISIIVPILGLLTHRSFTLIDLGYILSFLYLILFAQAISHKLNLFINFVKIFTIANIVYGLIQTILMNLGLSRLAMIHSNLPAQLAGGYTIPPSSLLPFFYRISGFFNESSPLIFYLSSSYVFLLEINRKKSSKNTYFIQVLTLITIAISGSKFSYAFLIALAVSHSISFLKIPIFLVNSLKFIFTFATTYFIIINYDEIIFSLTKSLPAFGERYSNIENSFLILSDLDLFGKGFLSSSTGEAGGLDAITIVVGSYGTLFGIALLVTFLFWILVSKVEAKDLYLIVYLLGLSSSGSFLIVQYTLFFTMIYIVNRLSKYNTQKSKITNSKYIPLNKNNLDSYTPS